MNKRSAKRMKESNDQQVQTGWPKQEKIIPPVAAETITTTKSEISLQNSAFQDAMPSSLSQVGQQKFRKHKKNKIK